MAKAMLYEPQKESHEETSTILAVVGSRSYADYPTFTSEMDALRKEIDICEIVSGGARGADSMAERYARENGIEMRVFKPDWRLHGRKAGLLRNLDIVGRANYVIAFWDGNSPGTRSAINIARKTNKNVKVIKIA